jgi:hypothetical protein
MQFWKIFKSEIFLIFFNVSTNTTSKCILISICRVIPSYRTFFRAFTFRQLVFRFSRDIISCTLSLVARFTEMSVTPAKPLSNLTAELTFKFYEILSMLGTFFNSSSNSYCCTFSAHEFFFFEIFIILTYTAFFFSTKIWIRTFKAHIIR